jgi:large subunit ribosomal protein L4
MTEINILNEKFENKSKMKLEVDFKPELVNVPVVHQVVKAILASRRQGNACTKTKAFVRGGGKKPFKQKGTGNARQGSSRSPLMPGGGTVFGPAPRSYDQKVNKKVAQVAVKSVITDKYLAGKLHVVDSFKSNGKTSELCKMLTGKGLQNALLITSDDTSLVIRAARNLEKAKAIGCDHFSVYEAVKYENLIIEKLALEKLLAKLG